jgi:hypothetical protein
LYEKYGLTGKDPPTPHPPRPNISRHFGHPGSSQYTSIPVLPDPHKPSRPILPKTTAGLGPFTAGKIFFFLYFQLFYEKNI